MAAGLGAGMDSSMRLPRLTTTRHLAAGHRLAHRRGHSFSSARPDRILIPHPTRFSSRADPPPWPSPTRDCQYAPKRARQGFCQPLPPLRLGAHGRAAGLAVRHRWRGAVFRSLPVRPAQRPARLRKRLLPQPRAVRGARLVLQGLSRTDQRAYLCELRIKAVSRVVPDE